MSIITVQLGQCGNQIGEQFFSTVAQNQIEVNAVRSCTKLQNEDFVEASGERFFNVNPGDRSSNNILEAR